MPACVGTHGCAQQPFASTKPSVSSEDVVEESFPPHIRPETEQKCVTWNNIHLKIAKRQQWNMSSWFIDSLFAIVSEMLAWHGTWIYFSSSVIFTKGLLWEPTKIFPKDQSQIFHFTPDLLYYILEVTQWTFRVVFATQQKWKITNDTCLISQVLLFNCKEIKQRAHGECLAS